jgi:predicted DNA-binding protein YlxM (UPF0122 family)
MNELTSKQEQFCYLYVTDELSIKQISERLDVHRNTLTNWLNKNEIKAFINEIRSKDAFMTLEMKRTKLMEIIMEQTYDEVVSPKTGEVVKVKSRTQDRISALKLLLQLDGDLQDSKTINVNFNTNALEAPREAVLIDGDNIIELDPEDFIFEDIEEEPEGEQE